MHVFRGQLQLGNDGLWGEQVCGRHRSVGGWAVIRDWQEGTSLLPSSTTAHTHHCFPPPRITLSNKRVTSANTCCSVMSYFLQPHGLQHTRFPCPSPSPGVCSSSCPLNQWCYLTVSSSAPLFSHLQSFPASGSFPMSQLFTSVGQSIGASASVSVLPVSIHCWFLLGLTDLISLLSKELSRAFSNTSKHCPMLGQSINSSVFSLLYGPALTSIHDYW